MLTMVDKVVLYRATSASRSVVADVELLNGKGIASCLELPSSVRREVEVEGIGREEVETAMHKMKKARRQEQMKCG